MSGKAKLVLVLSLVAALYLTLSVGSEPIEVEVEQ
ncbi:hypothetical protein SAMN05216278_1487 [Halopelagius longus]|uniref:Uncharacterized protein n=1 Tax=Halopelagius longus TaxID=1236180 RepID=A0A1H1ATS6_9EURY|nr:hypothetical protein SAMN05216278_1487 [Halopelagius longus]